MRLPEFVKKISPVGETLEAVDAGTALLAEETEKRNRQVVVATADTGLSLWEREYALPDGTGREELLKLLEEVTASEPIGEDAHTMEQPT